MFDIGFGELLLVMVVGILVIGPQQMPEAVRSVLVVFRKIRNAIFDAKYAVERELNLHDLQQTWHDEDIERHMRELNQSILDLDKSSPPNHEESALPEIDFEKLPDHDPYTEQSALQEQDTGIETDKSKVKPHD